MKNRVPKQELLEGDFTARLNLKLIGLQTSPSTFPALTQTLCQKDTDTNSVSDRKAIVGDFGRFEIAKIF